MTTQLATYVAANGKVLKLCNRDFEFAGVSGDGDIAVATFKTARASYSAVRCLNTRVLGAPGAEVWSIIGGRREVALFAIHEGTLQDLAR